MAPRTLTLAVVSALLPALAVAQQAPTPDAIQSLPTYTCTIAGGCVEQSTYVVFEWPYHWIHTVNGYDSCTTSSGGLNSTLCGTAEECYDNCEIAPGNYTGLGITTSGDSLTLYQYRNNSGTIDGASPNVLLLDSAGENYVDIQLLGQEFSFDVDISLLPCGENGNLFLSEIDFAGGRNEYNPAGAAYGFGTCDSQCSVGPYFNGTVNTEGLGSCCNEMDIWEANSMGNALTAHPCNITGIYGCTGSQCGSTGVCNENGCGWNPYQQGATSFYGPGLTVDTTKPFTVTTQFITDDGTKTGTLVEIRRYYTQNSILIPNPVSTTYPGLNSINETFCAATGGDAAALGGLAATGEALGRGMVLIFSIWQDDSGYMNWLDSTVDNAGPCNSTAGNPTIITADYPNAAITFSNIKWGELGSTSDAPGPVSSSSSSSVKTTTTTAPTSTVKKTTTTAATTTTTASGAAQSQYGQCAGVGWSGPTTCVSPYVCVYSNPYYSQCLLG
jgi:cellulase